MTRQAPILLMLFCLCGAQLFGSLAILSSILADWQLTCRWPACKSLFVDELDSFDRIIFLKTVPDLLQPSQPILVPCNQKILQTVENVSAVTLEGLGEVHTPSVADLFVAKMQKG